MPATGRGSVEQQRRAELRAEVGELHAQGAVVAPQKPEGRVVLRVLTNPLEQQLLEFGDAVARDDHEEVRHTCLAVTVELDFGSIGELNRGH